MRAHRVFLAILGFTILSFFLLIVIPALVPQREPVVPRAAEAAGPPPSEWVQLVAVQMTFNLDDYWSRDAFEAKIRSLMEIVADRIDPELPTLVVFPEDVGLMLVAQGMQSRLQGVASIAEAIEAAVRAHIVPLAITRLWRGLSWVPALFLLKHQTIAETYFDVFSTVAREYGVYLVAGSAVLPPYRIEDGVAQWRSGPLEHRVYNTSYLFGPDGKIIGSQQKVYLIELEREAALDLSSGSLESLEVFDTPVGRVGIAICLDAFQDDVIERLAAQGAQILVQPSANPGPWTPEQQVDWMRSSHQKTYDEKRFEYAVNPMMNGPLWEIAFYGQSSIVARNPEALPGTSSPTPASPGAPDVEASNGPVLGYMDLPPAGGFIRLASSDRTEEVLVARVPHPSLLR